jgi:hypothetical protein
LFAKPCGHGTKNAARTARPSVRRHRRNDAATTARRPRYDPGPHCPSHRDFEAFPSERSPVSEPLWGGCNPPPQVARATVAGTPAAGSTQSRRGVASAGCTRPTRVPHLERPVSGSPVRRAVTALGRSPSW